MKFNIQANILIEHETFTWEQWRACFKSDKKAVKYMHKIADFDGALPYMTDDGTPATTPSRYTSFDLVQEMTEDGDPTGAIWDGGFEMMMTRGIDGQKLYSVIYIGCSEPSGCGVPECCMVSNNNVIMAV